MTELWSQYQHLDLVTQVFFAFAVFFGLLFVWQLVMSVFGLGGHSDVNTGHDAAHPASAHHGDDGMISFQLLSFRSVLAFFTLFTWYTSMTLAAQRTGLFWAIAVGLLWGLAGMFAVAFVFWLLRKLGETGTGRIETCVGTTATVYADIPEGGFGQIRCTVSGVVSFIRARGAGGKAIKSGTPVQILWKIDDTSVEVEPSVQPN